MKKLLNNVWLKALSVIGAVFLWLIIVSIDDPLMEKTFRNVTVTVINDEVVTNQGETYQIKDNTQTVSVTVRGKRSVIEKIEQEDIEATADMNEMELTTLLPVAVSIPEYEGKYEEAYATPKNLQISIEEVVSNKFPITVTTVGTVRDGYALGTVSANPELINISGPESLIDSIGRVEAKVDVSGLSEDTEFSAELQIYDKDDNLIDQTRLTNNLGEDGVSVKVSLLQTKKVAVSFDTSSVGVAKGYMLTEISYEPKEIEVAGDSEVLETLSELEIPKEALKLNNLESTTEVMVELSSWLPEGLQLADESLGTVAVTVKVEQAGTKSFTIAVQSLVVNNLSENMKLTYESTNDIEITVEGSQEQLDSLELSKKVYIDLQGYQAEGTYDVPVLVELPTGCTQMEQVTVRITLKK